MRKLLSKAREVEGLVKLINDKITDNYDLF